MKSYIVSLTKEYVTQLLCEHLSQGYHFHNLVHTKNVVRAVKILSNKNGFGNIQTETLVLAAWLHDVGFTEQYADHEQASIRLAENFLRAQNYHADKITTVSKLIAITRLTAKPQLLSEKIMKDADFFHLGQKNYFRYLALLRKEWKVMLNKDYNDREWHTHNLKFLAGHSYYTLYCQEHFETQKLLNMEKVKHKIVT